MASKRAVPRTESVNRQSKGASSRLQRSSGQVGSSTKLAQDSDHSIRPTSRRNPIHIHSIHVKASDLHSEFSQIDTPPSLDPNISAASIISINNFQPYKRRRLSTAVDSSRSHRKSVRGDRTGKFTGSAHRRHPSIEETDSISTRRDFTTSSSSSNRRKTGPCNSKRLRGRGHVGGSSLDHIFITDLNQPTDDDFYPPTTQSNLATMPANLEDQNHPSTSASKVPTRCSRSQETVEPSGSGTGGSSNWFRSFACFANSTDDEQTALDLSAPSNRSGNTRSGTGTNQPMPNISESMVFPNPTQSELTGSVGVTGNLARLVTSVSSAATPAFTNTPSTSSSSRTLRHQRGGSRASSGRHDSSSSSRRLIQGSGRQSSSRTYQASNAPSPSAHVHQQQGLSNQSQSHHHQIQGSGINYRIMQLKNLRNDVAAQMLLLQEINQALLMGSDDSLAGLAVQELVSAVVDLLSAEEVLACLPEEEVIEIKNLCCNILAHLMDVIPKAADTVVMAVPLLINTMSCSFVGDILERIINVLEQVSRRNGRQVLLYGGVMSVMGYYDFVTVAQHRTILSMVANCFANVRKEDFDSHIAGCLSSLSERLSPIASTEPRCIERICLCFARLVHAFKSEPQKLRHIASFGLCDHLRHLLTASPPIVSNMRDISNMLATLCNYCPDLAVDILKMGYAETVYNLLTDLKPQELSVHSPTAKTSGAARGPRSTSLRTSIARTLEIRGTENVSAIISLIRAMLPPVQEGSIAICPPINPTLKSLCSPSSSLSVPDLRIALFREQCKTFENMVTRNKSKANDEKSSQEVSVESLMIVKMVHLLFPMLLDLYTELNGISPRLKCIEAIQRIVCNVSPFVLSWVVSPRAVSSMVADMLNNPEFSLIAAGLQLANIFIVRIPKVFAVYFRKEGVLFRLHRLASLVDEGEQEEQPTHQKPTGPSASVAAVNAPPMSASENMPYHLRSSTYSESMVTEPGMSRTSIRFQRLPANQRAAVAEEVSAPRSLHFIDPVDLEGSPSDSYGSSDSSSSATLDMDTTGDLNQTLTSHTAATISVVDNAYHDSTLRAWIKTQCQELYDRIQSFVTNQPKPETLASKAAAGKKSIRRNPLASHNFSQLVPVPQDLVPELEALSFQLGKADDPGVWIDGLTHLANLLIRQMNASEDEAPSPFEIQQSGMLNALQAFLCNSNERRLRFFLLLRVFVGPRYTDNIDLRRIAESPKVLIQTKNALLSLKQKPDVHELAFPMLVNCLLDCLHQQEHFQVLTNPASLSSTDAYAEEMFMTMRQSVPLPPPPQSTETPTRRNGANSSPIFPNDTQSSVSPPPRSGFSRRMAGLAPGYLKLELIRQVDESSPAAGSSSQGVAGASSSKKSSPELSIWDQAPASISLQISSLVTPQRLRSHLTQRCMIASVMHSPDDGDRFIPRDFIFDREEGPMASIPNPTLTQQLLHRRRGGRRNVHAVESMHTRPNDDPSAPVESRTQSRPAPSSSSTFIHSREELISLEREMLSSRTRDNPRSRNLSLLAAFGMLQFPGSTSGTGNPPSSSMAAAQALPSPQLGSFHIIPDVSVPSRSTTNPQHSHDRSISDATAFGTNLGGVSASTPSNVGSNSRRERGSTHPLTSSSSSSSSSVTALSSHQHYSTRLLTQQQQQQQSSHRSQQQYPMVFSGSPTDFLENVAGTSSLVPVFYVGRNRIPDRMPLYQALRIFSPEVKERGRQLLAEHRFSMTEQNREDRINAFIWRNIHTIHYVLEKAGTVPNNSTADPSMEFQFPLASTSSTASASTTAVKHSPTSSISAAISCLKRSRRSEESTNVSTSTSALKPVTERLFTFLEPLTEYDALNEGYMATNLSLLRILYGLSEFGNTLDDLVEPFPIVPADQFLSQKLSAKASRQLQDVFYILAGNLPNWLVQTISTCPFLFPFSVRQNFFYVHNFDRERTILHLQDTIANASLESETAGGNSSHVGISRRERGQRSSIVQRLSHFGRHSLAAVRYGGFDGGTAILENLLSESSPQIQRHKITVSRDPKRLLRSAETAMNDLRDSRSIVEIAFEGEVGFGLGPTLEFYTLVSHQLMASSLNLWHGDNYTTDGYIIAPAPGLYPRPLPKNLRSAQSRDIRTKFYFLGQLMARALLDWRQLDLSLSPTLLKWFLYVQSPEEDLVLSGPRVGVTPADLALVDPPFAKHFHSLLKLSRRRKELVDELANSKTAVAAASEEIQAIDSEVDDLCLTFVLPGYQIDLCRNGSQTSVTGNNLGEYLNLVANWFLVEGVRRQVTALISGFDSVLPGVRTGKLATLFRPDECEGLFCGSGGLGGLYRDQSSLLRTGVTSQVVSVMPIFISSKNTGASTSAAAAGWDVDTLMKSCLCDHGYTHQSTAIQYLFEIMSEFDETQRRLFIQFATGSPRLPIGGFRALKPPLKIVMKREAEEHADQHLPSVMTCQNYLKLPNYSSKKIMLEKLLYAIHEGQHAFHLS